MTIQQLTRQPTDFQQPVNEQELERKLIHVLPDERINDVTELEAGLFNNTYRVTTTDNTYVLKVAPVAGADAFFNERHLMKRERTIARELQSLSPLVPEYLDFFIINGRDAFLQPWIEGRLWHDVIDDLSSEENGRLWHQLGAFAKTIHNCQGDQFGYPSPMQGFSRWSEFISYNVNGMVEDCHRLGKCHPEVEAYCSYLPQFADRLDQVTTPQLLHGDIWPRNVIIDGAGKDIHIKAVFDGERAFWGDPCSEWVLLFIAPDAFWQGYGVNLLQSADPLRLAIYKGMYFILNILETTRFNNPDDEPRKWLASVNKELAEALARK